MKALLIIYIFLISFTPSCEKDKYYDLPQNEKILFKNNDTIFFVSNKNEKDSFFLQINYDYTIVDKKYYYESEFIHYFKFNKNKRYGYFIDKIKTTSISYIGYYYNLVEDSTENITLKINNKKYYGVSKYEILEKDNDTLPKTIYYSNNYGVIRYDYSDTLFFVLYRLYIHY